MKKKLLRIVLVVLSLAVCLSSAFIVVTELNHDCRGEDCDICEILSFIENTIIICCVLYVLIQSSIAVRQFFIPFLNITINKKTPTGLRVKLNN